MTGVAKIVDVLLDAMTLSNSWKIGVFLVLLDVTTMMTLRRIVPTSPKAEDRGFRRRPFDRNFDVDPCHRYPCERKELVPRVYIKERKKLFVVFQSSAPFTKRKGGCCSILAFIKQKMSSPTSSLFWLEHHLLTKRVRPSFEFPTRGRYNSAILYFLGLYALSTRLK